MEKKTFTIVPFCIYHLIDTQTNTYVGYIGYGAKTVVNNKEILRCQAPNIKYGRYKIYGSFYAITPLFRPIPSGLKLINAVQQKYHPYGTSDIKYEYDIFDKNNTNSINFLTWLQPVRNSVPLYIYNTPGGTSFPSFKKNPSYYNKSLGWSENEISPIFVLVDKDAYLSNPDSTPQSFQNFKTKNGTLNFKFSNFNGRCVPDPNGNSISECLLIYDEDILYQRNGSELNPLPLLKMITLQNANVEHIKNYEKYYKYLKQYPINVGILIFLISLITTIIFLIKK
jgi:hypothetical protein